MVPAVVLHQQITEGDLLEHAIAAGDFFMAAEARMAIMLQNR